MKTKHRYFVGLDVTTLRLRPKKYLKNKAMKASSLPVDFLNEYFVCVCVCVFQVTLLT